MNEYISTIESLKKEIEILRSSNQELNNRIKVLNTEKLNLEKDLLFRINYHNVLFESAPVGLTYIDKNGNLTEINKEAESILGLNAEEQSIRGIKGNKWEIIRKDGTPFQPEEYASVIALNEKKEVKNVIMGILKNDNSFAWISVNAAPIGDEGVIVSYIDLTELKKSEDELAESERLLNITQEISKVGGWVWDTENSKAKWTKETYEIYGLNPKEFDINRDDILQFTLTFFKKEDRLTFLNAFDRAVNNSENFDEIFNIINYKKENLWIRSLGMPFKNQSGKVIKIYGTLYDITIQKTIENSLIDRENLYRSLAENSSDMIMRFDKDFSHLYANSASANFLNIDINKIIGKTHEQLGFSKVETSYWESCIDKVFKTKQPYRQLTNFQNKYDFDWNLIPEFDSSGEVSTVLSVTRDITDIVKSHKLIEDSEKKFRAVTENAKEAIYIIDNEGNLLDFNHSFINYLEYTEEEAKNLNLVDWNAELSEEDLFQRVNRLMNHHEVFETVHKSKTGKLINVEISATPIDIDNNRYILYSSRDITEKKKFLERILVFSQAIEQSHAAIVITNADTKIIYINKSAELSSGYVLDEVIGKNPKVFSSKTLPAELYQELWSYLKKGDVWRGEFYNKKKNGELYWENAIISSVRNERNEIISYVAVKEDITDKKKYQQEIEEKNKQLAELNATKDKFFSIIAHDLKNPFGSFREITKILNDEFDTFTSEEIKEFLELLKSSSKSLYALLENLLEWSKTQRGTISFVPLEINLDLIFDQVINLLKGQASNKSIELILNRTNNKSITADPQMLNTIIRNLVSNAIKFTPENGKITINFEPEYKNDYYLLSISDNGVGMDDETKNKLFKIDARITSLGTNDEKGTGLGLILCKEFVDKHFGKIWVESEIGVGSTFYFTISKNLKSEN